MYTINRDYISKGASRPGTKNNTIRFLVAHDTGNPGSTAYGNRSYFQNVQPSASAHTFIDDKYILEIIPLDEIAYHVRYNVDMDNRLYGADANNAAIGVELCWGGSINFNESYSRYVWYFGYLINKYGLDPDKDIVAHQTLDPSRRTDPLNALNRYGITWEKFISDVKNASNSNILPINSPSIVKGVSGELPLNNGDRGDLVREVQNDLIKLGYSLPLYGADGFYGAETIQQVRKFQKDYNLTVDGIVGENTFKALKERSTTKSTVPPSTSNQNLSIGSVGSNVMMLQQNLQKLGYSLPKYGSDGTFGQETEDAVKQLQRDNGLIIDGIVGANTRTKITELLTKKDQNTMPNLLLFGDKGADVKKLQESLIRLGYPLTKFGADGDYGNETKQAVMNFQKANGLAVDGIAGIQTMKKVNELLDAKKVTIEAPYPLPNVILKQGSEGNNVKQVQQALKDLKLNVGTVDGIYGPKTGKAVRNFQLNYPTLKNDGIYGPNTRKYMMLALEN